ncbi:MAG: HdeD family acid-resistance protein [Leptolyngbya sp. IPPAS B-1204]|nr:HdeD family acid-resistance protein [Elainella sp. C42_A2020_010]RNJ66494.1 MAG: HdeD family acid-resistance protein [Leptolyngbya sp. IPPAS B-1204]
MQTRIVNQVRRSLSWMMGLGILMILLGIAAIIEPFIATLAVARLLSWFFLLAGLMRVVYALQSRQQRGFWLRLLVGILYIVTGILLLSNIFGAQLTLTLALGWAILIQGIVEVIAALSMRPAPNWGWMLLSGIVAVVLGILILYRWPSNAFWLLGVFTGISFILAGGWMLMIPWAIRNQLSNDATRDRV